jgi:hypothetical protein
MRSDFCTMSALLLSLSTCGRGTLVRHPGPDGGTTVGKDDNDAAPDAGGRTDVRAQKLACTFKGFVGATAYPPAAQPFSLIATDLNGDGRLDLLAAEESNNVPSLELFTNKGNGTFAPSTLSIPSKHNVSNLVAADFNGDGLVDLASQSNNATGIDLATDDGVLAFDFGTGQATFAAQSVTQPSPQTYGFLAVGDFDGDKHPDLAFAGYSYRMAVGFITDAGGIALPGPVPTNNALNIYRNTGNGTFAAPNSQAAPYWLKKIATGDFDGDGHLDIAELLSVSDWQLGVYYNAGDGTFPDEATFAAKPDWSSYGLGVADFNGDGIDDLATTTILRPNASDQAIVLEVFTGGRDRSFTGPTTYPIETVPTLYDVTIGDFNGDGKPDIALVLGHDPQGAPTAPVPVVVFENRGDGTFGAPVTYVVGGSVELITSAITAGDFNADGVDDIAVATIGRFSPYPVAVNVLLSRCE